MKISSLLPPIDKEIFPKVRKKINTGMESSQQCRRQSANYAINNSEQSSGILCSDGVNCDFHIDLINKLYYLIIKLMMANL